MRAIGFHQTANEHETAQQRWVAPRRCCRLTGVTLSLKRSCGLARIYDTSQDGAKPSFMSCRRA